MKRIVVLISVLMLLASVAWADSVTRKNLGDINEDGLKENAVEKVSMGASSFSTWVQIRSGSRILLELPLLSGDSADNYKVVGKEIVVWTGDWEQDPSDWNPHYYDLKWYCWDKVNHKYVLAREGFTVQKLAYNQAKKSLPVLAKNHKGLVLSRLDSFSHDAVKAVVKKTGVNKINEASARWYLNNADPIYRIEMRLNGQIHVEMVSFNRKTGRVTFPDIN